MSWKFIGILKKEKKESTASHKSHKTTERDNRIQEKPRRRSNANCELRSRPKEAESVCWRKKSSSVLLEHELRTPKRTRGGRKCLVGERRAVSVPCWSRSLLYLKRGTLSQRRRRVLDCKQASKQGRLERSPDSSVWQMGLHEVKTIC